MRQLEGLVAVNGQQCVSFRPRVASDQFFIAFENQPGCSSFVSLFGFPEIVNSMHISLSIQVGRQSFGTNGQRISLEDPACIFTGVIMHELIHALGMLDVASDSLVFYRR